MRLWASLAIALGLFVTGVGGFNSPTSAVAMQESTPEDDPDAEETPEEGEESPEATEPGRSAGPVSDLSLSAGQPAVLAQGLTFVSEGEKVWTVTEIDVPELEDAESDSGGSAIFLQRQGSSIIRNDVTGKRVKLEPGEAFFRAPEDAYTMSADGSDSKLWSFELVDVDDANQDAFYEGRKIDGIDEASYDFEMTRFILEPGDTADLPEHNGTALIMVLGGEIEVRGSDAPTALADGDGQTLLPDSGNATVSNSGSDVAMYVYLSLGDEVSDDTAGAGTANQQPTAAATSESPDTEVTPDTDVSETPAPGDGLVTSINIAALEEIYITVTVDGTVAYDGTLAAGQATGPIVGSTFEVYTSSGVNTQFTNACGITFVMGSETGEANYALAANEESCAP
jgi:uncharacterized cupin superfamily protein